MASTTAGDGTTIEYEETGSGDGPPIVLVHGITENRHSWDPIVERLSGDRRVISLDLRGHGESGTAERYDLESMAGDVAAVAMVTEAERPHLVGHSLGGAVVSATGANYPVTSVVNVDQSLQLGAFKEQLVSVEQQLRDPDAFPLVIDGLFEAMSGDRMGDEQRRVNELRRADQDVVLGVWQMLLTMPAEQIDGVVEEALAGYRGDPVPYLALFGIDPGEGYADWLATSVVGAQTEVWADHGHYPHLVDPDRFVDRLREFWSAAEA